MIWTAPPEKDSATETLEKRLWDSADQFRANSGLKAQEYSGPILGIIFPRFAEIRFATQRAKLASPSRLRGETVGLRVALRGSRGDDAPPTTPWASSISHPVRGSICYYDDLHDATGSLRLRPPHLAV